MGENDENIWRGNMNLKVEKLEGIFILKLLAVLMKI